MTQTAYLILGVVVVCVLYVVMRRRTAQVPGEREQDSGFRTVQQQERPAAVERTEQTEAGGLPPLPKRRAGDSGSSHPAYPVAPAKYTDAAFKSGVHPRQESGFQPAAGTTPMRRASDWMEAPAESEEKPWYPEAPASYDGAAADGAGQTEQAARHAGDGSDGTPLDPVR